MVRLAGNIREVIMKSAICHHSNNRREKEKAMSEEGDGVKQNAGSENQQAQQLQRAMVVLFEDFVPFPHMSATMDLPSAYIAERLNMEGAFIVKDPFL
jgi:hypothetical protein